jgi:hypothetical protein
VVKRQLLEDTEETGSQGGKTRGDCQRLETNRMKLLRRPAQGRKGMVETGGDCRRLQGHAGTGETEETRSCTVGTSGIVLLQ